MSWRRNSRVILLRRAEGLSHDEITEVFNRPRGTVMSAFFYARGLMRRLLKDLLKGWTYADCNDIGPLLGFFEDCELEPHEMQEVARHLAQCKVCERSLSDYTTLARELRAAVIEPSLENFAKTVQRRLGEVSVPLRVRLERRLGCMTERWTAGLALTSAALALGAWVLLFAALGQRNLEGRQDNDVQQTAISRLEARTPDVAVWSEPETKTTVIWLADEP